MWFVLVFSVFYARSLFWWAAVGFVWLCYVNSVVYVTLSYRHYIVVRLLGLISLVWLLGWVIVFCFCLWMFYLLWLVVLIAYVLCCLLIVVC